MECEFSMEQAHPELAVDTCDASDVRQHFSATRNKYFTPSVAFAPPQTKVIPDGVERTLRVLYGLTGLKTIGDSLLNMVAAKVISLWGNKMPLDLVLPSADVWLATHHLTMTRNERYAVGLNPVGFGESNADTLEMRWSSTTERMQFEVQKSNIVLVKNPVISMSKDRVYIQAAYSSEQVRHEIRQVDVFTGLTSMIGILSGAAAILASWQVVYPRTQGGDSLRGTVMSKVKHDLKKEAEQFGDEFDASIFGSSSTAEEKDGQA